jgi:hypothetical protein
VVKILDNMYRKYRIEEGLDKFQEISVNKLVKIFKSFYISIDDAAENFRDNIQFTKEFYEENGLLEILLRVIFMTAFNLIASLFISSLLYVLTLGYISEWFETIFFLIFTYFLYSNLFGVKYKYTDRYIEFYKEKFKEWNKKK